MIDNGFTKGEKMSCKWAISTDEYHGWECSITEGACMFLHPDSRACADMYGESPDAQQNEEIEIEFEEEL